MTAMSINESEACQIYPLSPFSGISIFIVFVSVQILELRTPIHFQ